MKNVIKAEELAMFLASIFLFSRLHFPWWWYPLLIFTPDLSMLGYLFNNKAGALLYNIFHHKGIAVALWAGGVFFRMKPGNLSD